MSSENTKQKSKQKQILTRIFQNPTQNKNIDKYNRIVEKNKIEKEHRTNIFDILYEQKNAQDKKYYPHNQQRIIGQLNDLDTISKFHDDYFKIVSPVSKQLTIESNQPIRWDEMISKNQLQQTVEKFKENSLKTNLFSFKNIQQSFDSFWKSNKLSSDSLFRKLENVKDEEEQIQNLAHLKPIDQLQFKLKKEFDKEYLSKTKLQNFELKMQNQLTAQKMKGEKKPILLIRKINFLKKFWEDKYKEKQEDVNKIKENDGKIIISPFRSATNSISVVKNTTTNQTNNSQQLKQVINLKNDQNNKKKYEISKLLEDIIIQNKNRIEDKSLKKELQQQQIQILISIQYRSANDLIRLIENAPTDTLDSVKATNKKRRNRKTLSEFEKNMRKCDEILSKQNSFSQYCYESIKTSIQQIKQRKQEGSSKKYII